MEKVIMSQKQGRGRPVKYKGSLARGLVKLVKQYGLTGAVNHASSKGVTFQVVPGKPAKTQKVDVSILTLSKLAKTAGVELQRGRRTISA
jgi:hypothetical protein